MYIYSITNKENNKQYIGKTVDYKRRWNEHKNKKEWKKYKNKTLYKAFKKYGLNKFIFKIIDICEDKRGNEYEIFWIKELDSYKNGYNETKGGDGGNLFQAFGKDNPMHGITGKDNKLSKQVICLETGKIYHSAREADKDYKLNLGAVSMVCRKKRIRTGEMHWSWYPTTNTIEELDKEWKNNYKKNYIKYKKVISLETGIIYNSINEVSEKNNKTIGVIRNHCCGRVKNAKWAYYKESE